jgi:hypothetical protein
MAQRSTGSQPKRFTAESAENAKQEIDEEGRKAGRVESRLSSCFPAFLMLFAPSSLRCMDLVAGENALRLCALA